MLDTIWTNWGQVSILDNSTFPLYDGPGNEGGNIQSDFKVWEIVKVPKQADTSD